MLISSRESRKLIVNSREGNLWVAMWENGTAKLYTPGGKEIMTVNVPAKCVTCPGFVGRELKNLVLTTARPLIGESPSGDQGGNLFCFETAVAGMPTNAFNG